MKPRYHVPHNEEDAQPEPGVLLDIAELDLQSRQHYASVFTKETSWDNQLHPVVEPQVLHFRQVPLRTSVKLPHSPQLSPT